MSDPGPLISAVELRRLVDRPDVDPDLRIADVRWYLAEPGRGRREYDAGHIPGAIFVETETVLTAPSGPGRHPLPDPRAFTSAIGGLGIGRQHRVVVYDDPATTLAASRLWWMLEDLGHPSVRLLDGGFAAWTAAGGPVSTDTPSHPPVELDLATSWTRVIDRADLRPRLGSVVLIDARAGERYRGEVEPIDPVAGHIPTAVSLPGAGNVRPDGRFLDPKQLRDRFVAAGALDHEVVTSCGSGVTACHNALAMRIAGLPDPILYPGSYSDWSRSGDPIAVGAEPGEAP
jgi:thiosulfate/3-mercaptopyruvate sulfurtransferase